MIETPHHPVTNVLASSLPLAQEDCEVLAGEGFELLEDERIDGELLLREGPVTLDLSEAPCTRVTLSANVPFLVLNTNRPTVDTEVDFDDLSDVLVDEIENTSPFGTQNPEPLFMTSNITVRSSKIVGNNHRRMVLTQGAGQSHKSINAICFNATDNLLRETAFARIAFRLRWNRWNNNKTIQLIIEDAQ